MSPAHVSYCLPPSTTRLSLLPDPHRKITDFGLSEESKGARPVTSAGRKAADDRGGGGSGGGGGGSGAGAEDAQASGIRTKESKSVGSPLWMAPEILKGEEYQWGSDVWSFGIILSEMDTRRKPYAEKLEKSNMWSLLSKIDEGDENAKPHFTSACPPSVRKLADDCLAYDRDKRPTFSQVLKR